MRRLTYARFRVLALLLAALLLAAAFRFAAAAAPGDPEDPEPPAPAGPGLDPSNPGYIDPRLHQPVMPENPTLADKGAQTWWGVCMACHGDAGQGLTDEWRATAFGEDQNCWSAKCHGPRHPEYGFTFPRIVPPAWGPGTLKRFVTADELHAYLWAAMPWWDPGQMTNDQAWEVTAFILRANKALDAGSELDIANASLAPVHLPIRSMDAERGWSMVWLGALALAAVGMMAYRSVALDRAASSIPAVRAETQAAKRPRASFFHHLHPATIPAEQARWRYTLGAGGMAVFLSLILLVTGLLEMYFYIPTPEQAAESVQTITFLVPYGRLVRGLHFWSAQALVVVAVVHMLRVIFTGAFVPPRRFNYLLGLALLVLVLFLDFTGYVLRWDEGIRWALVVGANLLKTIPAVGPGLYQFVVGGDNPGLATLTRFYAWHIFGLSLIMVVLVTWHIFRVRRDGGISAPPAASPAVGHTGPTLQTPPAAAIAPETVGHTGPTLQNPPAATFPVGADLRVGPPAAAIMPDTVGHTGPTLQTPPAAAIVPETVGHAGPTLQNPPAATFPVGADLRVGPPAAAIAPETVVPPSAVGHTGPTLQTPPGASPAVGHTGPTLQTPPAADKPARITRYELVRREVTAMLVAAVLLVLAAAWLAPPIAPTITDSPTAQLADARAPWFFLWVQHMLRFGDAFWLGVALPLAVLALLAALPYLFPRLPEEQRGRWFPPAGRLAQVIAALIAIGWLVLTWLEVME